MNVETKPEGNARVETREVGLLDQVIGATRQTEPDRTAELLRTLTDEAMAGTVTYSRNLTVTLSRAIEEIDARISNQLAAIMQSPKFTKLEGSWRGLHHLVKESNTNTNLKIRVLNASKRELGRNLAKAAWRALPGAETITT